MITEDGSGKREEHLDLDHPDLSEHDHNWLSLVAIACSIPAWRIWFAVRFQDQTALAPAEWRRLQAMREYTNERRP